MISIDRRRRVAPIACVGAAALFAAATAQAAGWLLLQHGGRSAAQAGALLARADEPSAVHTDPAALVALDGLQLQVGLDFNVTDVTYRSAATGSVDAVHEIQFPPEIDLSWKRSANARWAVGIGVDSPIWLLARWPAYFSSGRSSYDNQVRLLETRAALAWRLDERWSVGGALRYVRGNRLQAVLDDLPIDPATSPGTTPIVAEADSTVDGSGAALALRYGAPDWGAAVVWSSSVAVEGRGRLRYHPLALFPSQIANFASRFATRSVEQRFDLPATWSAGLWRALDERTRVEADVELAQWSIVRATTVNESGSGPIERFRRIRDWRDTLGVRLGAERRFNDGWRLAAGLAWQEAPPPDRTRDLAFPYPDARVVSVGGGYDLDRTSFDVGWSWHDHPSSGAASAGDGSSSLRAHAQVFSFSVRWRLGS